jgi:hypothetical protein
VVAAFLDLEAAGLIAPPRPLDPSRLDPVARRLNAAP